MNRSYKYLEYIQSITDSLRFLQSAKAEKKQLEQRLHEYLKLINSNSEIFATFPSLTVELQSELTIEHFNYQTSQGKIDGLKEMLVKLSYMHYLLKDLEQIKDPILSQKISLREHKEKFRGGADRLVARSVNTLHHEMKNFESLFKTVVSKLNDAEQKRDKLKSLAGQDLPLISQFPVIANEIQSLHEGEASGTLTPEHVIANYASIRDSLNKINESSKYFSRLSKDYLAILSDCDLKVFDSIKKTVSLSNLSMEFAKINSKTTEYKNRMLRLDTLRNQAAQLRKEVNEKVGQLSAHHQTYVRNEMAEIQNLLFDKPENTFEKAGAKINMVRELLKKEFRSNDQRGTDALYIRQYIGRYESNIWQEDLAKFYEELNLFVNGSSKWTKDDFTNSVQNLIKEKNQVLEITRKEFDLFFSKNREYKNRFEKIENTKSAKKELEDLVREMGSFKPLKNIFYKFIK